MKAEFSTTWKSSSQPRKQRKYQNNAPLHIRHKFLGAHLSDDLSKKLKIKSLPIRVGDKVRIMRGSFKKKEGKVNSVDKDNVKINIDGIDMTKKDGNKRFVAIHPSNVMIIEMKEDKKRVHQK